MLATLPADYSQVTYVNLGLIINVVDRVQAETADMSDAALACAGFESKQEAQAAYDRNTLANADLDRDFDGSACDDFFVGVTPVATPGAAGRTDNIEAFAMVVYERDGMVGSSAILYIAHPSERNTGHLGERARQMPRAMNRARWPRSRAGHGRSTRS